MLINLPQHHELDAQRRFLDWFIVIIFDNLSI